MSKPKYTPKQITVAGQTYTTCHLIIFTVTFVACVLFFLIAF